MKLLHTFKRANYLKKTADNKYFIHVNATKTTIFDGKSYEEVAVFKDVDNAEPFLSDDGKLLILKNNGRKLSVYNLETMELVSKIKLRNGFVLGDNEACFSPDNKYILTFAHSHIISNYIAVFNIETGIEERFRETLEDDHKESNNHISYIPKLDKYLIQGFRRPKDNADENQFFYLLFDLKDKNFLQVFSPLSDAKFIFNNDSGEIFAHSNQRDNKCIILSNNAKLSYNDENIYTYSLVLSNDSKKIAVKTYNEVILYQYPSAEMIHTFGAKFARVSFSADDKELLIASDKSFVYEI